MALLINSGGNQQTLEPLTDSPDHIHQASTLCVKIVAKQEEYSNQQWRAAPNQEANLT